MVRFFRFRWWVSLFHKKKHEFIYYLFWTKDKKKFNPSSTNKFSKTPYIIRREDAGLGFFAVINFTVVAIAYAEKKGYIPVVDMKNYPSMYLDACEIGRVNAWEYYCEQPAGVSLEEALQSREYIIGRDTLLIAHQDNPERDFRLSPKNNNFDMSIFSRWRKMYEKYLHFKPNVIEKVEQMKARYAGKKILGVLVRGTDYAYLKPRNHPIPPTAEQAIAKAKEAMSEHNFDAVYLATEDKKILTEFQASFGEKLLSPECDYIAYDYDAPKRLAQYQTNRKNDRYLRGLDYIVSMIFLAGCDGFITSQTSGAVGVMCLSDGWEYLYVFDLGYYP